MHSWAVVRDICEWHAFPRYDLLYTDPPWEDRMVKFFQTTLRKQTGIAVDHTIDEILGRLMSLADPARPLVVEYSTAGAERVIRAGAAHGHSHHATTPAIQSNGKPYVLISFGTTLALPPGLKGPEGVKYVVRRLRPRTVFDPFAGIGVTARAVMECGVDYIGGEVNPARCRRLQAVIAKMAG